MEQRETLFPAFAQEALYQRIANHVRKLIETKQLEPGERLPAERELAQMLGVSRVPIREAMRTLAAQGLIEVQRGRGMFVAPRAVEATIDELTVALLKQRDAFEHLFAVRRLLEPAACRWAASRTDPEDIGRLHQIVGALAHACTGKPPDFDAIGARDAELHWSWGRVPRGANCESGSRTLDGRSAIPDQTELKATVEDTRTDPHTRHVRALH